LSDVASIIARRKPRRTTIRLLLDGELDTRLEQLRTQIRRAKQREAADPQGLASTVPQLEAELARLTVEADEATTEFTFQAIPRTALEDLRRNHPPTEEQWQRYKESVNEMPVLVAMQQSPPEFDWLSMAPALLAACAVEPKMTRDEAQMLWDELSDAEAAQLFNAAWGVNEQAATRPFSGTDTATTPNFGPDSTTPQNGESPSLSLAEGS
jgi:seryl-tRNA synthetase